MSQVCQSCGMPLRTEYDLGTNADGSKNQEYCHGFAITNLVWEKEISSPNH